jgi:hopene-associated glycosyltransferase HpnB
MSLPFLIGAISLAAWIYLLVFHGSFWRARERLPETPPVPSQWPHVVAVLPARDEAETIKEVLERLVAQDFPGPLSILLVDDDSDDDTSAIAHEVAQAAPHHRPVTVLNGAALAEGWTGKLWALSQGVERARVLYPDAEFFLFSDADIGHGPQQLRRLVAQAQAHRADLVSLMARLRCSSAWERLLIPAFVYFFQKLYPFAWANDPNCKTAAAAGGCVLIRAAALTRIGGIAAIRGKLIDDCSLARAVKASGGRLWLGLADHTISLRGYTTLGPIWSMVARSAYTQLFHSPLLLIGTVIGMSLLYLAPPLLVVAWLFNDDALAGLTGALAWLLMMLSYGPILRYYGRSPVEALLLPKVGFLYTLMTLDSARRYYRRGGNRWKGRDYGRAGTVDDPAPLPQPIVRLHDEV